jgi:hypothetical protein
LPKSIVSPSGPTVKGTAAGTNSRAEQPPATNGGEPPEQSRCLRAGLAYLGRGWSPLALCPHDHDGVDEAHARKCRSPGKRPLGRWKEFQSRLPTKAELREAWRRCPGANVGIALGAVSGLVRVDVEGDAGEAELRRRAGGDLPHTLEFTSGRGRGLLYAIPEGAELRTTAKPIAVNEELRLMGTGSQTVLPPSRHRSGRRYQWGAGHGPDDVDAAPAPGWLVALMRVGPGGGTDSAEGAAPAEGDRITEGSRNTTLTSLAGVMRNRGMGEAAIRAALREENRARCQPPLDEAEIDEIAASVARYAPAGPAGGKRGQADLLVDLTKDVELFHTPGGHDAEGYASVEVSGHRETWPVAGKGFRRWLGKRCHDACGKVPGAQAVRDALNVIAARAVYDGSEHEVHVRLALHDGAVYLDLCDRDWRAVRIAPDGWEVDPRPPVRFRRTKAMLPLPEPVAGGSVEELRWFVNVTARHWPLVLGWLVAALRPGRPFPVLCLSGEHGSAKSTTARVCRGLIDPNTAPLRSEPREARDLAIAAGNSWVAAFDNLSFISAPLSDNLSRLSTGSGFSTRTLYENDEETIFQAMRPIILNGIEEVATRPDLLDRALLVKMPVIKSRRRRTEADFWAAFEAARPRILGALLDAVAAGLRNLPGLKPAELPRMADFCLWAAACEPALGLEEGAFLEAFHGNRRDANASALESSPVVKYLMDLMAPGNPPWEGTAADLLARLGAMAPEDERRSKAWPRSARGLRGVLDRLKPNLRQVGIHVRFTDQWTPRGHLMRLYRKDPERPLRPLRPLQGGKKAGKPGG